MFPCVFSPPYKYSISPLIPCVPFLPLSTHACLVFLLPFLLRSLFFLSYFLEPWWRWSGEAQLGLRHWGEADTNYEGTERKQKRSLNYPVYTSYDTHYRIIIIFFVSMDVMGLRTFALDIIWTDEAGFGSWKPIKAWNLSTNCGKSSSKKRIKKKKTTPKCLTKGSKMQTLGSTRCGSHVNLSDWNKWTTNRHLEQKCMDGEV